MKYIKKTYLIKIAIISIYIIMTATAYASGFVFQWESFVVDNDLILGKQSKEVFIDNSPLPGPHVPVSENYTHTFDSIENKESSPMQKAHRKSFWNNIKIDISSTHGVMDDQHKLYSDSDDEKISKLIDAMTSLIYDDSKIKSLETIGGIIEPQINFYFEF